MRAAEVVDFGLRDLDLERPGPSGDVVHVDAPL
jgi:hypothetical protein